MLMHENTCVIPIFIPFITFRAAHKREETLQSIKKKQERSIHRRDGLFDY